MLRRPAAPLGVAAENCVLNPSNPGKCCRRSPGWAAERPLGQGRQLEHTRRARRRQRRFHRQRRNGNHPVGRHRIDRQPLHRRGRALAMSGGSLSATSASLAGNCTVAYGARCRALNLSRHSELVRLDERHNADRRRRHAQRFKQRACATWRRAGQLRHGQLDWRPNLDGPRHDDQQLRGVDGQPGSRFVRRGDLRVPTKYPSVR